MTKVIHVVGADQDASAGQAACDYCLDLPAFLLAITEDADIIYLANDSLRQDTFLDLLNLILNARLTGTKPDFNGSVFFCRSLIENKLLGRLPSTVKVEQLHTTTTAVFCPEQKLSSWYTYTPRLLLEKLTIEDIRALRHGGHSAIEQWIKNEGHEPTTCYDETKFLNVWLKIQEMSLLHPDDTIVYHLVDDKIKYGAGLYNLFKAHPELLPSNVSFTFDHCVHDRTTNKLVETAVNFCGDPTKGKGKAYSDYKQRLKQLAITVYGRSKVPLGETIDCVGFLKRLTRPLDALIPTSETAASASRACVASKPAPTEKSSSLTCGTTVAARRACVTSSSTLFQAQAELQQLFAEADEEAIITQLKQGCHIQ